MRSRPNVQEDRTSRTALGFDHHAYRAACEGPVSVGSTALIRPSNGRFRRHGDPERAAPKVRFRHDRRHSHSAGDLPGDPFHDFPGWVRPAFSKGTYLIGFTLDNTEVSVRSRA